MPEHPKRIRATFDESGPTRRPAREAAVKLPSPPIVIGAAVLLVIVVLFARFCTAAVTIEVTVNGTPITVHGAKTLQTAIRESGLPINPGDYISISGATLKKSAGEPFDATVNGAETTDPNYQLWGGETITVSDGKDTVEGYDTSFETIPFNAKVGGAGALHVIDPGEEGYLEIRVGRESGEVVRRQRGEPTSALCTKYNPEVGDDKLLCLTFDEGPSESYTSEILDVLKENDARATFFCTGIEVEKYRDELVRREHEEGHQVCTDTYDHARRTGGMSVEGLSGDELVDQVERGRAVLSAALGGAEASRVVRLPGGKLNEDMVRALSGHVSVEVGWNVDSGDWLEPGADAIYDVLVGVESGDIVLLHDGGGDMSGTVEALRRALPELREQGFSFVTIDEILDYPPQT